MKKILIPLFVLALVSVAIFMGQNTNQKSERWVQDPRAMNMAPDGNASYSPAPIVNENFDRIFTAPVTYNTPAGMLTVNPNVRVHPSSTTQSEVPITRHPTNQSILFASANTWNSGISFINEGVYVSTNAGISWYGWDTLNAAPITGSYVHLGDPAPVIALNGYFHESILRGTSGYSMAGIWSTVSTNNGYTWANSVIVTSAQADKNHSFTNDVPSSPYAGRVFATWSNWVTNPNCVVSYTTDNGATYSAVINVATPLANHYHQGVNGATMPNGDAIICWQNPTSGSPYTGDYIGFAKSTNGGATWTANNNIYDCNGIRGSLFAAGIRVNDFPWMGVDRSGGPRNGWIYIATAEKNLSPAGTDADIVLHKSTDGGTTWSAGVRVNQDQPLNNGKVQYMPALRVDEFGGVNVVYYDNRNVTGDSVQVYVSRSIDGGATWTDILVSDHSFKPGSIAGLASGYQGDYIGITSGNNKVYPYWADNKSGLYQAWVTTIDLGPAINHTPLGNTEQTSSYRVVNCTIIPAGSGINPSTAKLYYSKDNPSITTNVALTNSGGTNWTAQLPLSGAGLYRYYLTATDSLSRNATAPAGAPTYYYSFIASPDTVKPVITTTPVGNTPKNQWPVSVSANVTDNIGIDSVWVKWYKRPASPVVIKQFKLNNTSGSNYSGIFNSDTSQVSFNDTIFYRVFARDNGSNHNVDSTALYNFKIIAQTSACIGNGTVGVDYPYYTYYMDSRTQMLYTASEILAAGGAAGFISKLGFNVTAVGSPQMDGFNIRIQNTSATSISSWVTTGWTTVFTGSYNPPGTGIQYINLTTPFAWNGTSNLLVEVCFDNTSWTTSTTVMGTTVAGTIYHQHLDNASGCSLTGSSTVTARPNLCVVIDLGTSSKPVNSSVPGSYNLSQNYPNPFNPTTKINFAIPKEGLVTLKVYDLLGREVETLVNEVKTAGYYSVDFNASALSSGVYFYKVQVNGFTDVKKMILMK